jgi:hypothetical protein
MPINKRLAATGYPPVSPRRSAGRSSLTWVHEYAKKGTWARQRTMALVLARDDALVFGDIEGQHRNPEHTSRQFNRDFTRCGEVPPIRLPCGTPTRPSC